MSGIPVLLAPERLRVLVVGGGAVAARKVSTLLEGGAAVRVVAPAIGPALRAARDSFPRLVLVEREYDPADVGDANLVIAATSSREVNARVARDADRLGRIANVADAGSQGVWTGMASHRAGGLVIAVGGGGVPGAAVRIRDELARRFDGRYGRAVAELAELRAGMLRAAGAEAWRDASADLLGPSFCDEVESGALALRLARWTREDAWR